MNYKTDTHKRRYQILNPHKYLPTGAPLVSKSDWEYKMFRILDTNEFVIKWGYEVKSCCIQYLHPSTGRYATYFPDFIVQTKDANGKVRVMMIEVKPAKFTQEPKPPAPLKPSATPEQVMKWNKRNNTYQSNLLDYRVNIAKWMSAKAFCESKGMIFQLVTDKNTAGLFG